jgi:thiamine monophosphate synthase
MGRGNHNRLLLLIPNLSLSYIFRSSIFPTNIKMDLREIGFGDVDWIHLAQNRDRWRALVNTVMNVRVP